MPIASPSSNPVSISLDTIGDDLFYISRKFDGIRATVQSGKLLSKTKKPIPNKYITEKILSLPIDNVEGEIVTGDFQATTSDVMTRDGEPSFNFIIFNVFPEKPYYYRFITSIPRFPILSVDKLFKPNELPNVSSTDVSYIKIADQVVGHKDRVLKIFHESKNYGYEGIMLRSLETNKVYKLKHQESKEAVIVGFNPLVRKTGVVEDMVGSIIATTKENKQFKIGTGLDHKTRINLWERKESLIGELVTFTYDSLTTNKIPRFPRFVGIRHQDDMS